MNISAKYVSLPISDGTTMQAYTAQPEGDGPFPGIIVFQEAFGVNSHIRNLTERFASEGYVAIAPEIYHRSAPVGFEAAYTDFPSVAPHAQAMTIEGNEADMRACWDWLQNHPAVSKKQIACTGYCMGGRMSFVANSILPFKAAISYYAGNMTSVLDRTNNLHAPMLFFWGGLDKHIPHEIIEQVVHTMHKAEKPHINVEISYADHGFFCDERASYSEEAAKVAWALTLAFLKSKLA